MYYVLSVSDDYAESYCFNYDHDRSPNYLSFQSGALVGQLESQPVFRLNRKISVKRLLGFDFFTSDGGDFISTRFADLIRTVAPDDVQLIAVDVYINGERIDHFYIANIVPLVACIDMEKSIYRPLLKGYPEGPMSFTRFEFIEGSLKSHKIVRCKEDPETVVVSEDFVQACKNARIKGVEFLRDGLSDYE